MTEHSTTVKVALLGLAALIAVVAIWYKIGNDPQEAAAWAEGEDEIDEQVIAPVRGRMWRREIRRD